MHIKKTVWVYFNKTLLPERDGGREGGSEGRTMWWFDPQYLRQTFNLAEGTTHTKYGIIRNEK